MPSDDTLRAPRIEDIRAAAKQLAGVAVVTPLLESPLLNARLGGRVLVKAEVLQRTGSFKFRGAYNHVSRLTEEQRTRGVVAFSSGNHAQGVAAAAGLRGAQATIVMPENAPALKIANTRSLGADVRLYGNDSKSREEISEALVAETGAELVRPFDNFWVIAGQGTVGLEIASQCAERGAVPDAVLAPAGGGGLIAGVSLALSEDMPAAEVFACEPEGFDDHRRSLEAGERLSNDPAAHSICDALLAPRPGEITFSINQRLLSGGFTISDNEARAAMAAAFRDLKIVIEPGGAVALAAVLGGHYPIAGRTVVVVASGGNADPQVFSDALKQYPAEM